MASGQSLLQIALSAIDSSRPADNAVSRAHSAYCATWRPAGPGSWRALSEMALWRGVCESELLKLGRGMRATWYSDRPLSRVPTGRLEISCAEVVPGFTAPVAALLMEDTMAHFVAHVRRIYPRAAVRAPYSTVCVRKHCRADAASCAKRCASTQRRAILKSPPREMLSPPTWRFPPLPVNFGKRATKLLVRNGLSLYRTGGAPNADAATCWKRRPTPLRAGDMGCWLLQIERASVRRCSRRAVDGIFRAAR